MATPDNTLASKTSPTNEFFGNVLSAFEAGFARIGDTVLPNWVARELNLQQEDGLNQQLFFQEAAPYRVDSSVETARAQPAAFDIGSVNISGSTLLVIGVVLVGGLLIFSKR